MPEVVLETPDRARLRRALVGAYHNAERIESVLQDIGFPPGFALPQVENIENIWQGILHELDQGRLVEGYRTLLAVVLERYPANDVFLAIATRYFPDLLGIEAGALTGGTGGGVEETAGQPPADPPTGAEVMSEASAVPTKTSTNCHVIVRAATERQRQEALDFLTAANLHPSEVYSTNHVILFEVAQDDASGVRETLDDSELIWTVVPPGGPAYLISHLIVQGPDGRSFRFTDVPAQTTVSEIAADTLAQYPDDGVRRGTVTDQVQPDGQGVRLDPQSTLHRARVRDGAHLRVGHETNAGAVDPIYHAEALSRAGNQIRAFVDSRPGMKYWTDSAQLASCFELEFSEPSFGPPAQPGGEPVDITEHVVQIEFQAEFPRTPPAVFWLSEIFHPNIYPNYDSDAARRKPAHQGLVCLGELTDSYQPALDLGRLCQALIDLASYRDYEIDLPTGRFVLDEDGQPREIVLGNAYDVQAAGWAKANPARIAKLTGRSAASGVAPASRYRNVVEPADHDRA